MKLEKVFSKLLTNKYFLYVVAFLSLTNVLGYMMMQKFNAVALFILVGIIARYFSKNMSVVLLIPLVVVNLLTSLKQIEGLETMDDDSTTSSTTNPVRDVLSKNMDETGEAVTPETKQKILDRKKQEKISEKKDAIANAKANNMDDTTTTVDDTTTTTTDEPFEVGMKQNAKNGSRIDYGATVSEAYDQLDKILGSDGVKGLTNDTQNLMKQQMKLAEAMESMGPLMANAKGLMEGLKGFDLSGLGLGDKLNSMMGKK